MVDRPSLKTAALLLILLPLFFGPYFSPIHQVYQAPPPGKYEQQLAVSVNMIGAPNATLKMTNLDLSNAGIVSDSNYVGANVAAFVIDNNDSQPFGNGQQGQVQTQLLQFISQPALITFFNGSGTSPSSQSSAIEAQFSQALGVPFTTIFSLPTGQGSATIYAPNPELSNYDALAKIIGLLPSQSFSSLINTANIQNMKYFAALGLVPININGRQISGLSFYLTIQYPREYYKGGTHQLNLKSLLGFPNNIVGDAGANASLVTMTFQSGTILYNAPSLNPFWNNATSSYYLNVTASSAPDFVANFGYPFAPNIVIQKIVTPTTGPVGTTHAVVVTIQNLDNVSVSNVAGSDPEALSQYLQTLQVTPSDTQTVQSVTLPSSNALTMSYTVTTGSSGIYVLSASTVSFQWTAPNGTTITYSIATDPVQLDSVSNPWIQFTTTFNDFQPYSYLLLIPLLLTPMIETYRLFKRRGQKKREKALLSMSAPPTSAGPPSDLPKDPGSVGGSSPPPS